MLNKCKGNSMSQSQTGIAGQAFGPGLGLSQLGGLANQAFNQQYNTYQAQAQQAALYNQALAAGLAQQKTEWMINGRAMSFEQFLDELFPDTEDAHRSFMILKYKGVK